MNAIIYILLAQRSVLHGLHMCHFFICNSIAIDFGIDCSSISSKALRPFHLTEVTKLFNRFTSQRLLPTHGKIHFNKTMGLDKLI